MITAIGILMAVVGWLINNMFSPPYRVVNSHGVSYPEYSTGELIGSGIGGCGFLILLAEALFWVWRHMP